MAAARNKMRYINPDLQQERNKATFDTEDLTHIFDGGKELTDRRRYIENIVQSDELMGSVDYTLKSVEQKYDAGVRKACLIVRKLRENGPENMIDALLMRSAAFPNEASPMNLQFDMFLPSLDGQMTDAQRDRWYNMALNYEIIGTYAQTELGHGTHLRGLETTATYDPKTEEFVLHSPTLTSLKWWPGGLGRTTNHSLVVAQLYTRGECKGPHLFLLQTRCLKTHKILPGISMGDIGPTFGFESIDNGYLKMDNVRIPRDRMLMKHAQVEPDGRYVSRKSLKMQYGVMLFVRATMLKIVVANSIAQAVTIAIRYSAVRRQSEIEPGTAEPQVLDFVTQQHKLLPIIAEAWAITLVGAHLTNVYFEQMYDSQQGSSMQTFGQLHVLSSGLKAFCTDAMRDCVETCRLSCGGHGYSHASGLPKIYIHSVAACTYEGENTVLYLQCGRSLLKSELQHLAGGHVSGIMSYLNDERAPLSRLNEVTLSSMLTAYRQRAAWAVRTATRHYNELLKSGINEHHARNQVGPLLVHATKAHCHYFVLNTFHDTLLNLDAASEVTRVLWQLCELYAVTGIIANSGDFIQGAGLSATYLASLHTRSMALLAAIRPNAVALVDAFDFSDITLGSVLGRWDGQVYENLWKWAQQSPLNKSEVHESFYKYIQPLNNHTKSKL